MLKITFTIATIIAVSILGLRFAMTNFSTLNEGIMEGLQSCRVDSDCIWVARGCCGCGTGGAEMLINKDKELLFKLLVKDFCFDQPSCSGENACHAETVFCDRTCKFGERIYDKPLLLR